MTENQKFAKFVKEKRTALGISIHELSKRSFGSESRNGFISEIENGVRKSVTFTTAEKILKALNSEIKYEEN